MRRRLLNLLTTLSLALCVATAAWFLRSARFSDWVYVSTVRRDLQTVRVVQWDLVSGAGGAWFERGSYVLPGDADVGRRYTPGHHAESKSTPSSLSQWRRFHARVDADAIGTVVHAEFPIWLLALLFAVLPGVRFYRRLRRLDNGHCRVCCYDLRATPDRCPECGNVATAARRAGRGGKAARFLVPSPP